MRVFLCLVAVMWFQPVLHAQRVRDVQLKNSKTDYVPRSFHISSVVDDRRNNEEVGTINTGSGKEKLIFREGADKALQQFINTNVRQDRSKQAIVLHIVDFDFNIKRKSNFWNLDCTAKFAFYAADKLLVEYTGSSTGEINTDPVEYAGRFIKQTLENDMRKFDGWWGQNSDKIATSPTVKVNFILAKTTDDPELIVYSTQRPVRISDFTGPTGRNPAEMAATSSGHKETYTVFIEKGQLVVNYAITPYFDRSNSWFKQSEQNARVLAHEQVHFDITALKVCELVNKMRTVTFTKSNYQELLEKFSNQVSDETNAMQEQYDAETDHGTIAGRQQAWQVKVREQLRNAGCY